MKKSIRIILTGVLMVMLLVSCATTTSPITTPDVEHTITVMSTNDHHGHPVAFYDYPAAGQGGLPAQATLVKEVRAENDYVMVLSAGDFNTGRPESNFFKAEPDIIGMNYIRYDALGMGNHEFDPSAEDMQKQIADSNFPWLCANVVDANGDYIENVEPYIIKDYKNFKVAILGLMGTSTEDTGNPENIEGYVFRDEVEVANELVPMLKEQADIVIALVHVGLYDSEDKGSKRIARDVPGLALVVDGHTHTKVEEAVMVKNAQTGLDVPIVQAKHWGLYMTKSTISFMNGEVTGFDYELLPVNVKSRTKLDDGSSVYNFVGKGYEDDKELLKMLTPYVDKVDAVLNEVIGTATAPFFNGDTRKMETAIGDMVADSMLWYANSQNLNADFAFQNGGGIRTDIADGDIQKRTIYEVLPFDNSVAISTLMGSDVIELFALTPANVTHGAMPQVSKEVSFTIDVANNMVEDLLINGKPVDPNAEYRIATNSYLAAGGDGYKIFKNAIEYYDTSLMQRDAFIDYVIDMGGTITPMIDGRMMVK